MKSQRRPVRARSLTAAALAFAAAGVSAGAAQAATVVDPSGDFLPTFAGPAAADLDLVSASASLQGGDLTLTATLDGAVGTTPGGFYVWGINRGGGQALFQNSTPQLAPGVKFDAVVILRPDLTGAITLILPTVSSTPLDAGSVTVSGNTITGVIPISLLTPNGFTPERFRYNVWPRSPGAGNTFIADFAPDNSSFFASVPEPAAWALMLAGFGMLGASARRRRPQMARLTIR
jgi:hypothetical protein